MNETQCKDCQHFVQHYGLDKQKIFRLYCGHCTFFGPKTKKPDTQACEHFTPGIDVTEAFATKEYLSKRLLDYILSMELLPKIEDAPKVFKKRNSPK